MSRVIRSVGQGAFVFGTSRTQIISRINANTSARHYSTTLSATVNQTQRNKVIISYPAGVRNLYSPAALGIDKLERIQERKEQLFAGPSKERYIQRLKNFVDSGDSKSLFKDDLVNLIGIAENDEHLDLLEKLITAIDVEQESLQGWGTTCMRLYYKLNQLDRAVKNLHDVEKFNTFFNQRGCYKVVMSMLFKAGRFREVIDLYHYADTRLDKRVEGEHERYLATLAFASLAKINNQDALVEAEQLLKKIGEQQLDRGVPRTVQFLAYLAVNNGNPKMALNLISGYTEYLPLVLKDLKLQSLIKLERYEDILIQLREYISKIRRDMFILHNSTYTTIQKTLSKVQDENVSQELSDILVEIKEGGHVTDATLEDLLFQEINEYQNRLPRNDYRTGGNYNREPFRHQNNTYNDNYRPRPRYNNPGQQYNNNERRYGNQQRSNQQANDGYGARGRPAGDQGDSGQKFTYQKMDFSS